MSEVWVITTKGSAHQMGADEETTELARLDPYFPRYHPAFTSFDAAQTYLLSLESWQHAFYRAERVGVRS